MRTPLLLLLLAACGGDHPLDTDAGSDVATAAPRAVPPSLTVESPQRAAFLASEVVYSGSIAAGDAPVAGLSLNEADVAVDGDGRFSATLTPPPGLLVLGARATDADGGRAVDGRSVQVGSTWTPGATLPRAVRVELSKGFLDDNTPAKDDLASVIEVMLADPAFGAKLTATPMSASGVDVQLQTVTIGGSAVDISPGSGVLHLTLNLQQVDATFYADASLFSTPGTLHMDALVLQLDVVVHPGSAGLVVEVPFAQASIQGFSWTASSVPSFLTGMLSGVVQGVIEDKMTEQSRVLVRDMVADTLNAFSQEVVYGDGGEVIISVAVADAEAHPGGLVLWLDGSVRAAISGLTLPAGAGSLRTDAPMPSWPLLTTHDMSVVIDDDLVNQTLFAFWHAGLLTDLRYTGAELTDLTGSELAEPLGPVANAVLGLQLPPVVSPPSGDGGVDLSLGEVWLQLERQDGEHVDGSLNMRVEGELVFTDTSVTMALDGRPAHVLVHAGMMRWPSVLDPGDLASLLRLAAPSLVRESGAIVPPIDLPGIPLYEFIDAAALAGAEWHLTGVEHRMEASGAVVLQGDVRL